MPVFARESRNGVTGREYPRKPTWSARRQSTVTTTRERFFIAGSEKRRINTNPRFSSDIPEIPESLLNHLFFLLVELCSLVLGRFPKCEGDQGPPGFRIVRSAATPPPCTIPPEAELSRIVLPNASLPLQVAPYPGHALAAIIRSSSSRANNRPIPVKTMNASATAARIPIHGRTVTPIQNHRCR